MSHQARGYRVSTSEKKEKEKKKPQTKLSFSNTNQKINRGEKKASIYKMYQRNASVRKSHKFQASLLKILCTHKHTHMCILCLAHMHASLKH